ncbi:DUF3383 family protein [Achromobacter xylosoxidans]|uniref:DUF3383 family protein n=1 Tax=Alcaligenes xylosoxydans xylosoxydans TaxID=85698 RepID=UPI001EEF1C8F|nr:DUF3383 family protein [Achromobacter xylosoxidans]
MANLERIVNVAISLNTTAIKQQNFSDILVLGAHALAVGRILVVSEAAELLELGLSQRDPLYIAVRDAFKQIPTVPRVFVGRRHVETSHVAVTRASASDYVIRLSWPVSSGTLPLVACRFTGRADSTPADIAAGLVQAIVDSGAPVSPTSVGSDIYITAKQAGLAVAVSVKGDLFLNVARSQETPTAALTACSKENADWYGVALASRYEEDILDTAEWVESNGRLFGVSSAQAGILDAAANDDLASKCQQKQYFRTHVWFHGKADSEALDAAVAANRFTFYPGGETWANARLAGITYDGLGEGQALAAHSKNANTFEQMRSFAVTQNGKVAAGEWIDVIRGRDWLAEQVKIEVATQLVNAPGKVPFTDDGIQVLVTGVRKALMLAQARGLVAPDEVDAAGKIIPGFVISAPLSMNIPTNDKANRVLRDLKFSARLAGAIHVGDIKGNLTYQQI